MKSLSREMYHHPRPQIIYIIITFVILIFDLVNFKKIKKNYLTGVRAHHNDKIFKLSETGSSGCQFILTAVLTGSVSGGHLTFITTPNTTPIRHFEGHK